MKKIIVSLLLFTHGIILPSSEGHTTQSSYFVIPPATALNNWTELSPGDCSLGLQVQPDEYTAVSTPATAPNHLAESNSVSDTRPLSPSTNLSLPQTTTFVPNIDNFDILALAVSISKKKPQKRKPYTPRTTYKCDTCEYKSIYRSHFKEHKRTHTGDKPYKCDECNYTCSNSSNLSKHKSVHKTEKLSCSLCNSTFNRKDNLKRHLKNKHLDTPSTKK